MIRVSENSDRMRQSSWTNIIDTTICICDKGEWEQWWGWVRTLMRVININVLTHPYHCSHSPFSLVQIMVSIIFLQELWRIRSLFPLTLITLSPKPYHYFVPCIQFVLLFSSVNNDVMLARICLDQIPSTT